jgi:uncharacterized RDD family membrane protein YckC
MGNSMEKNVKNTTTVTLKRRFVVIGYDFLLLFALLLMAGILSLPLTGDDLANYHYTWGYRFYLLSVAYIYFALSWTRKGQTLGMKTWGVRVEHEDGRNLTWFSSLLRFSVALVSWSCAGAGFWWALFDKHGRTWHDILSKTRLVRT